MYSYFVSSTFSKCVGLNKIFVLLIYFSTKYFVPTQIFCLQAKDYVAKPYYCVTHL